MQSRLHRLEEEFGMSAAEILDVINARNRCKIAVRGAIAEAHLARHLKDLLRRQLIEGYEDFDRDGFPDCRVDVAQKSYLIECKLVRKLSSSAQGRRAVSAPLEIDFQRTRNPIDRKWERYYLPSEFSVVAACLWNRTRSWEFRFASTLDLPRHSIYPDRLATKVVVDMDSSRVWNPDLLEVLPRAEPVPSDG